MDIFRKVNVIKNLSNQILNLEHQIHNKELNKKIKYKINSHNLAKKQLEIINMAKNNLLNRNKKIITLK